MSITAYSGPVVSFGSVLTSTSGDGITGQEMEHNDQRAPSFADLGDALMDPRQAYQYQPGSAPTVHTIGFFNNTGTVDYVPVASTAALNVFVTSTQTSSALTTFTIPSTLGSSATGIYTTTIIAPETGKATGTLLAIDSTAAYVTFGSAGTMAAWNPGAGTGRAVLITTSSSGDGGTFTIAGRDMYGYKMTETLALSQGTTNSSGITITGQKAFKYISSITNTTTPTSTSVSIGFSDRFGFPLAVPYVGLNAQVGLIATAYGSTVSIAISPSSVNTLLASTAATQTSTTPDVRGTYKSTTATNGTIRLQMVITPSASAIAAVTSTNVAPLFGGTQYSSV